ncbi:hypothetical protein [Chitinophaga sp. YIM B06452]|uniref:hypothetical protein n=1 Tax=Chitinophaga sp. YIM B06452 TaxID=3082158 RepID=UPI0031FE7664
MKLLNRPISILCTALTLLIILTVPSCKKQDKGTVEQDIKYKLRDRLSAVITAPNTPADTVTVAEAQSFFQVASNNGGLTPFADYPVIIPDYELAVLWTAIDVYPGLSDRVALYIPLAQNWQNGKRLTMIVAKEHGFLRGIFVEDIPNASWLSNTINYSELSGVQRYFKYNGTMIKAVNLSAGLVVSVVPPGPAPALASQSAGEDGWDSCTGPDDWPNGPDEDYDNDGIRNGSDCCVSTPAGVWVDSKGCPLTMDLSEFVVRSEPAEPPSFPPWDFITQLPIPEIPTFEQNYPIDMGLGVGGGGIISESFYTAGGPGTLCGHYSFQAVGNSYTANIQGAGQRFQYYGTDGWHLLNVVFNDLCVQLRAGSENIASAKFIDAFNYAISRTVRDIDKGHYTNPSVEGTKLRILQHMRNRIAQNSGPGYSVSNGPCQGPIPISQAKYVTSTGGCQ